MRRFLAEHAVVIVVFVAIASGLAAFLGRQWVAANGVLVTVWVTIGLLSVTAWYAATTRRIAQENQQMTEETGRLATETRRLAEESERAAATNARSLLIQSIPVVAVKEFEATLPAVTLQNVGQAAAIIQRVRVELGALGGGAQTLDSQGLGSECFNQGNSHGYALAAGNETYISLQRVGVRTDNDPLHSACEVFYHDIAGNQFLAKHEMGRTLTIAVLNPGGAWQVIDEGIAVDPTSGKLVRR